MERKRLVNPTVEALAVAVTERSRSGFEEFHFHDRYLTEIILRCQILIAARLRNYGGALICVIRCGHKVGGTHPA